MTTPEDLARRTFARDRKGLPPYDAERTRREHDPLRCKACSSPYHLRMWDAGELAKLTDEEVDAAVAYFRCWTDRETYDSIRDFSIVVHEQIKRIRARRGAAAVYTPPRYAVTDLRTIQPRPHQRAAVELVADALDCG